MTITQHTFLTTCASSGIGLQLVYAALKAGHKVLAATRNPYKAAINNPAVEKLGGRWLQIDVSDKDAETAVSKIVTENEVDVLVNNAGYAMLGAFEEMRYLFLNVFLRSTTKTMI